MVTRPELVPVRRRRSSTAATVAHRRATVEGRDALDLHFPAPTPIRANLVFMAQSMCVCFGELSSEFALQLSSPFGDSEATRHLQG